MTKQEITKKLFDAGVVAVVRGDSIEDAMGIIDACVRGGIKAIEITMTIPYAVEVIREAAIKYKDNKDVLVGAGTVLDSESCRACIMAGAEFIVSPNYSEGVIKTSNRYAITVASGAMTITEAIWGLELGATIIKVFPGNAFGPSIIKAFRGPVPQAQYMPTGGVDLDNMADWFKAGVIGVGIGSDITNRKNGSDYSGVEARAKEYVAKYNDIKK